MLGVNGIPFDEFIMTEVLRFELDQAINNGDEQQAEKLGNLLRELEEDQAERRGSMGGLWTPAHIDIDDGTVAVINRRYQEKIQPSRGINFSM